jgi:hypothetical protein
MATIPVGAKLEHENGSGWLEVQKCKSVNFPGFNVSAVDTTNLGNTDYAKTYIPGMIDAGSVTFECEYTTATYVQLTGLLRDVIGWRVSAPAGEGDVVTCDGFLVKIDVPQSPDEEMMITGEIKMTGLPAVT